MLTNSGHLTYCTNIHTGETWKDHFNEIKEHFPSIKNELSPGMPMGIGLRLSHIAAVELIEEKNMETLKDWLGENNAYIFTMNGFPYGSFHDTRVKDQVHAPDWTTSQRVDYTITLFEILKELLPEGMDGGVSTSPLSYKYWHTKGEASDAARKKATDNIIIVAEALVKIYQESGKILHIDIEPEPDGMLETGKEFMQWFLDDLLKDGTKKIALSCNVTVSEAKELLREHVRLCYDVCHFAIGYEPHESIIKEMDESGIKIGKIQISAALKAGINNNDTEAHLIKESFAKFDEPTYLHQVVAKKQDGQLIRYPDLPEALADYENTVVKEWRAHFHVPIFEKNFPPLESTQADIIEVLKLQKNKQFTSHLEVETYTWDVIPASLKFPLRQSIIRELAWVIPQL